MAIVGRKYHMARRGVFASKMAWHLLIVLRVSGAAINQAQRDGLTRSTFTKSIANKPL
jgi:hypothetical protein